MNSIGPIFKAAREKRKITASQAAAATRMKIQHVEAIEAEQFQKFAAPAYARGFIKLYAEYLGLDPAPFLKLYNERFQPVKRPSIIPEDEKPMRERSSRAEWFPPDPVPDERSESKPSTPLPDFRKAFAAFGATLAGAWAAVRRTLRGLPPAVWRRIGAAAVIVLLCVAVPQMARCSGARAGIAATPTSAAQPVAMSALIAEPPEPYVDLRSLP